jgi:hypothetical protein
LSKEDLPAANKGKPLAQAARRTREVAQEFVVTLGTLRPSVTHLLAVNTRARGPALVEFWTPEVCAVLFVLAARAVLDPVTPEKHRQAVHLLPQFHLPSRTQEMRVWAVRLGLKRLVCEASLAIHVNDDRPGAPHDDVQDKRTLRYQALFLVTAIQTVVEKGALLVLGYLLPTLASATDERRTHSKTSRQFRMVVGYINFTVNKLCENNNTLQTNLKALASVRDG